MRSSQPAEASPTRCGGKGESKQRIGQPQNTMVGKVSVALMQADCCQSIRTSYLFDQGSKRK